MSPPGFFFFSHHTPTTLHYSTLAPLSLSPYFAFFYLPPSSSGSVLSTWVLLFPLSKWNPVLVFFLKERNRFQFLRSCELKAMELFDQKPGFRLWKSSLGNNKMDPRPYRIICLNRKSVNLWVFSSCMSVGKIETRVCFGFCLLEEWGKTVSYLTELRKRSTLHGGWINALSRYGCCSSMYAQIFFTFYVII